MRKRTSAQVCNCNPSFYPTPIAATGSGRSRGQREAHGSSGARGTVNSVRLGMSSQPRRGQPGCKDWSVNNADMKQMDGIFAEMKNSKTASHIGE